MPIDDARTNKAIELAQGYVQRESDAVALVNQILTRACVTIDTLMADALLPEELDFIERMDRLTSAAEGRRNAALQEIDRRRAVLGEALRRSVQGIEAASVN